ncbi:NAD(P)-dependent oxidoreductase, partial [Clostridioides difficile]
MLYPINLKLDELDVVIIGGGEVAYRKCKDKVEVEFVYNGNRDIEIVDIQELESGITFKYDEILSVHSKEPT